MTHPADMPINLLLVDDRPENLLALRAIFEDDGYVLWEAQSGEEALKCLLKAEFAAIVLDVQMPGMDGFETARLIKKREKTRQVPIIFVTAISKEDAYVFQGYEVGAVDYVFKPFDPRILRSKVGVLADLHRHKQALVAQAEDLRHANRRLRELDTFKDNFLAVISHELRTPLNFITGFASILGDGLAGELSDRQLEAVDRIMLGADRMEQLVSDLLDYAKIQAGKLTLTSASEPYKALVDEVLTAMRPYAEEKGIALDAEVEDDALPSLDRHRITQVLTNLVSNAVKFTPAGGQVAVRAFLNGGHLVTEVRDTGIGIAPEDLPRIFEGFTQVDMSATREAGGTGLGLAISKSVVEAHGGHMGVQSLPGVGTTFTFTLPMAQDAG